MSSSAIWRGEVMASALSAAKTGESSALLRQETIDSRLEALKKVALTLLDAVDSLRSAKPSRGHRVKLQDEVQRFESDLIRAALERTGGNQARAARLLSVKHTTLNAKIKRYQIRYDCGSDEAGNHGPESPGARTQIDREIVALTS
jgi:transcriptional regulator with GAF, ATPase, and Fis domain